MGLNLFPKEGGGALRRLLDTRRRLVQNQWRDNRPRRGPFSLFDFRRRDDVADLRDALRPDRKWSPFPSWRASDDGVIGGYSTGRMALHEGDEAAGTPPFLRWSGTLSTEVNHASSLGRHVTRSGFAAIMSPEFPFGANLKSQYKALEVCCRTDGRRYNVNLKVETYFPEDLYQGVIGEEALPSPASEGVAASSEGTIDEATADEATARPGQLLDVREHLRRQERIARREDPTVHPYHGHPPAGFRRLVLPFTDFVLTSRGRPRQASRDLDGSICLESIGFTLMDGQDGDFCFDLVSVRAVNVLAGEVVNSLEDDTRLEELGERLRAAGGAGGEERDGPEADTAQSKPPS